MSAVYTYQIVTGGVTYPLPDWESSEISYDFSDIGVFKGTYAKDGVNYSKIVDNSVLIAYCNGVEQPNSRFLILAGDGDDNQEDVDDKFTGKSLHDIFRRVICVDTAGAPNSDLTFDTSNPGQILNNLFTAAQARGAMTGITWTFTTSVDSGGVAWPKNMSITYRLGVTYLTILQDMIDKGLIEYRFEGTVMKVFIADGMAVDRSVAGANFLELRGGLDYTELPRKWSSEERAKFSMTIGDENILIKKTDNTQPTGPFGITEQAISQGGTKDTGLLTIVNDAAIARVSQIKEQLTRKIVIRDSGPVPNVNYFVGDYILERVTEMVSGTWVDQATRYRIRSLILDIDGDGTLGEASMVLNDQFLEAEIRTARRVNGILNGGTSDAGGSPTPTDTGADTTTPSAPTGLTLTSQAYLDNLGRPKSAIVIDWNAPTTNTNGSVLADLGGYEVNWRYAGDTNWNTIITETDLTAVSGLDVGRGVEVRVRAFDTAPTKHFSVYTSTGAHTLASDSAAPSIPSTPIATNRLGSVQVRWDGLNNVGGGMEADFSHINVYRSQTSGFTIGNASLVDRIFVRNGTVVFTDQAYGSVWFYKFASVDTSGNVSAASTQTSVTTASLVNTDVIGKVLDGAKIMDQSLLGPAIAPATIDTSKLVVGALGDNKLPNPYFDENDASSNIASWGVFGVGSYTLAKETAAPIQGTQSAKLTMAGATDEATLYSSAVAIPVVQGEQWYVEALIDASRAVAAGRQIAVRMWWNTNSNVYSGSVVDVGGADMTGSLQTISGVFTVPATAKFIGFSIHAPTSNDGSGYDVLVDSVVLKRRIVSAVIQDGAITTPKLAALAVDAGKVQANAITVDKLAAGAVEAEKIKLGVIRSNLVPDPSFEESYLLESWEVFGSGVKNPFHWRYDNGVPVAPAAVDKTTLNRSRSGTYALSITAPAGVGAGVVSGAFPLKPGSTYRLTVNAASLVSAATMVVSIECGTGDETSPWYYNPATLTGDAQWLNPTVITEPVDPSAYDQFSWLVTVPTGVTWGIIRCLNFNPAALSTLIVDDVSFVEIGYGASELTAAGLRLFGEDGREIAAFVNNRPNYLSVLDNSGNTIAGIGSDGAISGTRASIQNDPRISGFPLLGSFKDFASPTEATNVLGHMDKLPRGVVGFGVIGGGAYNTRRGLFEVQFKAERGRSYRLTLAATHVTLATANVVSGFGLNLSIPSSPDGVAPTPNVDSINYVGFSQSHVPTNGGAVTLPTCSKVVRCNQNGDINTGGELRAGLCRLLVFVTGDLTAVTVSSLDQIQMFVEDIGPDIPENAVTNASTPGSPATVSTKGTYVSTWYASNSEAYRGSDNTARADTVDLTQGYESSGLGDQYSYVVFSGNAVGGETSKDIGTALTGATIKKIEIFLFNYWWMLSDGGRANIRQLTSTTIPGTGTIPTGTLRVEPTAAPPFWSKGTGRWIDITSIATSAIRGFAIGPVNNSFEQSRRTGRFAGHTAAEDYRPKLRITYVR